MRSARAAKPTHLPQRALHARAGRRRAVDAVSGGHPLGPRERGAEEAVGAGPAGERAAIAAAAAAACNAPLVCAVLGRVVYCARALPLLRLVLQVLAQAGGAVRRPRRALRTPRPTRLAGRRPRPAPLAGRAHRTPLARIRARTWRTSLAARSRRPVGGPVPAGQAAIAGAAPRSTVAAGGALARTPVRRLARHGAEPSDRARLAGSGGVASATATATAAAAAAAATASPVPLLTKALLVPLAHAEVGGAPRRQAVVRPRRLRWWR